jgi:MoaA/NifB/PqqE/SkfB family radical SAM enzyme
MQTFPVEKNPYRTVYVDLTHRCNMRCNVCYRPDRALPDLDLDYFAEVCRRLPHQVCFRILGGEPTLHPRLTDFISAANEHGHVFTLGTNGKKLADRSFARDLVTWRDPRYDGKYGPNPFAIFIDLSGGLSHDELYEQFHGERCAEMKISALNNLLDLGFERLAITAIIVRGLNEGVIPELLTLAAEQPAIRAVHFRSMARVGRWIAGEPYGCAELTDLVKAHLPDGGRSVRAIERVPPTSEVRCRDCCHRFMAGQLQIGIIEFASERSARCWYRGQLVPNTFELRPWFEHMLSPVPC